MSTSTKDSLIKGTVILAVAALVARALGIFQRVPLDYVLGTTGSASFNAANNLYLLLLVVATAGIPSTISKMISERMALGKHQEAQRIYQAALMFGVTAGVVITVGLYSMAPYIAKLMKVEEAVFAIRALAPALLFFPLIAMMRGYFQGRQMMMAGGLSQIVEQILRVSTAVLLAYLLLYFGYADKVIAAGATFGGVMGSLGALGVMLYFTMKLRRRDLPDKLGGSQIQESSIQLPYRRIYVEIFKVSIPIVLTAIAVPFIYTIDSLITIRLTEPLIGYEAAKSALDIMGMKAQSLAGIPPILAIALSQSIIPVISAAYAVLNHKEVTRQASQALRISIITGAPIVAIMCVAARPINGLLFEHGDGVDLIVLLTMGTLFQIIMMTSGSILLGLGKPKLPMGHIFIGLAVKLIGSFVLAPWLGVQGIIIATTLCFLVTAALNLRSLGKLIEYNVLGGKWTKYIVSLAIMIVVGIGLEWLTHTYIPSGKIYFFINCVIVGGVMMVLYPLLLGLTKVVLLEDVKHYPAPLRKLISRVMKVMGRSLPSGSGS